MGIGKALVERLRTLATDGPEAVGMCAAIDGYQVLEVAAPGNRVALELFDYDRYSLTMRGLELSLGAPAEFDPRAYLSERAAALARGLSYLEEPLAVWELEHSEGTVQLRSSPPQREGDERSYWEVVLTLGEQATVRIARYRWAPGMSDREVMAYPATFALVGRMTESLAVALAEDAE